jgi:hypothetical protein
MAKVTPGPIISNISGSVGSATFRNDKSGLVLYQKPVPTTKRSDHQMYVRSSFKRTASAWRALDDDIRLAWTTFSKSEPVPSFFSRGRKWSGRQLFSCFFQHAEAQNTPLPARWLPTPPLFFKYSTFNLIIAYPKSLYIQNPEDPLYPGYFYGYFHILSVIPDVLNPINPAGFDNKTPCSFYIAAAPLSSNAPPRSFVRIMPPLPKDIPYPPGEGFMAGMNGQSYFGPLFGQYVGNQPGFAEAQETAQPRTFCIWFHAFALSDARLNYTGNIRSTGYRGYASGDSPAPNQIYYPPPYGMTISYITVDGNYPKTSF